MNMHNKASAARVADKYVSPDGGPPGVVLGHVPDSWGTPSSPTAGHNNPPGDTPSPYDTIKQEIEDLFLEAKNWADGEPIADQKQADAVTALLEMLSDAMSRADEARKEEKRPLDEAVDEIQRRYNALIGKTTKLTGRAVMAKEALQTLLTPWRNKLENERRAEAARLAKEAADAAAEAQAAMQASRGNLEERDKAEELYQAAQDIARVAKRADKAATTKTGLRSVWSVQVVNMGEALEWAWARDEQRFNDLAIAMAKEAVDGGMRTVPGFKVIEERVAR